MHAAHTPRRDRRRAALLAVATLLAASGPLAGGAPAGAQRPPKPESTSPAAELAVAVASVGGEVVVQEPGEPVTAVGAPAGQAIAVDGGGTTPRSAAQAFVEQYGAAFGETEPAEDLTFDRATPMGAGGKAVHYQQEEGGVPVMAGELAVQVASGGKVRSAGGELSVGDPLDVVPDIDAATAAATSADRVAAEAGLDASLLATGEPALWVYDPALLDEPGARRLVWRIEVHSPAAITRDEVLVDAHTGEVVVVIDRSPEAGKHRQVCDSNNVSNAGYTCPSASAVLARSEGGAPSGVADVNAAYDAAGATYDFYFDRFGRDSIDGEGMTLRSTVRSCPNNALYGCPMQNAFWDGGGAATGHMVYGQGFAAADDVVAHELTHGVTQFESNLIYFGQSGAINESMSDVFGELVDLTNGLGTDTDAVRWDMGEDVPGIGAIRDMADPGRFGDPDRMGSPNYYNGSDDSGGVHWNSGVGNKAAFLITDGQNFNGQNVTGLGITKAARIFYEAQVSLLTSGTNYQALGNALKQACTNVIGIDGITAADCLEVAKAVTATEMIPTPPANDDFANATTINGATGFFTGSTVLATRQTGEPCHGALPAQCTADSPLTGTASIWFRFTAAGTGTATFHTCGSSFDTLLAAYTGSAVGSLTQVASNDDNGVDACGSAGSNRSYIQFAVTQGTTYSIAVDGWSNSKGAVSLNWWLPAPTGVSGTVTETGTGTPVAGAMVAVLNSSTFAIAGGGVADGAGNFIALVPVGSYYLYVIDPAGGHTTGFFGAPTPVTVNAGTMVDRDPTMPSARGALGGTVSTDSPAGALGGAWALAVGANGDIEAGAVANGSGQYSIANLAAAAYKAVFLDPTGAHRSEFFPNSSDPAAATPIAVSGGATATANVSLANQSAGGNGQSLTGTVTETGTGAGLSNVLVLALRSSDLSLARAAVTNGSGAYTMGVDTGTYKLGFVDTAGLHLMEWFDNQPNNGLAAATNVSAPAVRNADLARRNGSITGTVTADGSAAALTGVWVLAIDATGKIAGGATTAGNGTYTISGLRTGTYRVTFVDPAGGYTQEFFDNSPTSIGATPVVVTGGATATANAGLHHP